MAARKEIGKDWGLKSTSRPHPQTPLPPGPKPQRFYYLPIVPTTTPSAHDHCETFKIQTRRHHWLFLHPQTKQLF
jgi:hypothetical protein